MRRGNNGGDLRRPWHGDKEQRRVTRTNGSTVDDDEMAPVIFRLSAEPDDGGLGAADLKATTGSTSSWQERQRWRRCPGVFGQRRCAAEDKDDEVQPTGATTQRGGAPARREGLPGKKMMASRVSFGLGEGEAGDGHGEARARRGGVAEDGQ